MPWQREYVLGDYPLRLVHCPTRSTRETEKRRLHKQISTDRWTDRHYRLVDWNNACPKNETWSTRSTLFIYPVGMVQLSVNGVTSHWHYLNNMDTEKRGSQIPNLTFRTCPQQYNIVRFVILWPFLIKCLPYFGFLNCVVFKYSVVSEKPTVRTIILTIPVNTRVPRTALDVAVSIHKHLAVLLHENRFSCVRQNVNAIVRCENCSRNKSFSFFVRWNQLITTFQVTWKLSSLLSREI